MEKEITERQYRALMATQGAWLSPDQIAWLSPDQIARLSPAGMKKHAALWDKVPTVSGLYGRILTSDERYAQERGPKTVIFKEPIPYKGQQGWFNVPDSILPPEAFL